MLVCAFSGLGLLAPAAGSATAGSATGAAGGASAPVRIGRAPEHPRGSRVVGSISDDTQIATLVTLKPQDGLAAYAQGVSQSGSPDYHRYLTPAQFRARFGATAATVDAVDQALRVEGLSPGRVSANGLTIPVIAAASTVGKAFDTAFQRVQLASGRVAYANSSAPALPASVSNAVQGVVGLDSLSPPEPESLLRRAPIRASPRHRRASTRSAHAVAHTSASGGPTNSCVSEGTGSYWNADQIASAYGFNGYYAAGDEGAGQTVALLELEPDRTTDISHYESCYGVSPSVSYVTVDGGAGTGAGQGEAALDIEQIAGLAPQASIDVFQAPNTDTGLIDDYQKIVDTAGVDAISTSWGQCEAENGSSETSSEATIFEQAATENISVYAAVGDSGSSDCYDANKNPAVAVDDPASQPYVTGAGGTSLPQDSASSQTVWNDSSSANGAGGGGISSVWTMPSYQSGAAAGLGVINGLSTGSGCRAPTGQYCRELPDVSADADPLTAYPIYWHGGWIAIGGTSAAAPLWAAYTALVNASAACNGTPIGFANPLLYMAADNHYGSDFTDITSGNNDYTPDGYTGGLYPTGSGYDMATGLGTPVGGALGGTLCAENDYVTLANPGEQTGNTGTTVGLSLTATDSEGHALTFTASGLPSGVAINSSTGAISGQLPASAGAYAVTVTATAGVTGVSASQTFAWYVESGGGGLAPVVTAISPASGSVAGGANVTITGENLSGASVVDFGSTAATDLVTVTSTKVTARAPAGSGTVDVTVTTGNGTSPVTASDRFNYVSAPVVSGVSPDTGPTGGGTSVTITGENLSGATGVDFGTAAATNVTIVSDSEITASAPAGSGAVDVTVTTANGTSAISAADEFTYATASSNSSGTSGSTTGTTTTPVLTTPTGTTSTSTTTTTTPASTVTTTTVRFYRCVHTCRLIATHGATTYKPTKADYGSYLKVITTRTTAGVSASRTRWIGPITAATAGDLSIPSGAHAASALTVRGSTGKALADVRIDGHRTGKLTLTVQRATGAKTRVWAYVVGEGAVVSSTAVRTLGRPVMLTLGLKSGQTVKLAAVRT